jgi:hypothetical protein
MPWWLVLSLIVAAALSPLMLVAYVRLRPFRQYRELVPIDGERIIESAWAMMYLDGTELGQHSRIWLTNLRVYASPSKGGLGGVKRPVSLPLGLIASARREKLRPLDFGRFVPLRLDWFEPRVGTPRSLHLQVSKSMIPMPWSIETARFYARLRGQIERSSDVISA